MNTEQLIQHEADARYPNGERNENVKYRSFYHGFIEGATFGASLNITKPTKEELLTLAKECMKLPCTDDLKSEEQLYVTHVNHFLKNHTASLNGWVSVKDRLPNYYQFVVCKDVKGNMHFYRLTEYGWNLRDAPGINTPENNLEIVEWLDTIYNQ